MVKIILAVKLILDVLFIFETPNISNADDWTFEQWATLDLTVGVIVDKTFAKLI